MKSKIILSLILIFSILSSAQQNLHDKGIFIEKKKGFYDEVLQGIKAYDSIPKPLVKSFKADLSKINPPKSLDEFKSYWRNDPISQGQTGTCWSFSTTSFLESEVYRQHNKKVKLSEIFTVYWEYLEKAKAFVKERGKSLFDEGSEGNAVTRIWKKYGCAPEEVYNGLLPKQKFHNHKTLVAEMNKYLKNIKSTNAWNEDEVVNTIKSILNHYLGEPPAEFNVDGKKYTPKEYLTNYLQINPDDYVDILSYMQQPYYQQVEYEVPDNWWHSKDYYNVPLDEFMSALKKAVREGYTMAIGGDVSEAGLVSQYNAAIVPSFDIPSEYIDEDARQFRFSNGSTTDDHGLHLAGYTNKDGKDWYLIKDSGAGSMDGKFPGYFFYNEDYVKLKMMDFMVHKDAVKDLLSKFKKQ